MVRKKEIPIDRDVLPAREPPQKKPTWTSTEFIQSAFVQLSGFFGMYTGHISDDSYVLLSASALGVYTAGRSYQKRHRHEEEGW
jgi:hypothetical protein